MSDVIGGYHCLTPMQTAGSGSARWCIASRGMERFFLKEFLSPVYPSNLSTPLGRRQLERCGRFESKKQRLYAAASCVIGDVLVPVIDFFRSGSHYYAVSEAAGEGCLTAEDASAGMTDTEKRKMLFDLAVCLQRLHLQGVVHADLKPEHVLIMRQPCGWRVRLIDLDSGFLTDDPPCSEQELEGDPAYLAPEVFLKMTGEDAAIGAAVDRFAFGTLIHQIWTGKLPGFDREKYHYLYEAALEGAEIRLDLPKEWHFTVLRMLSSEPMNRPSDAEIAELFLQEKTVAEPARALNGLSKLMKV